MSKNKILGLSLAALMAATRMHHFGSSLHLPDASLAVFILAGFLVASPLFFGALLLEAGLLDYVAITHIGVSDYCVTSAYWFLIPTYAVLWGAGRYYARLHRETLGSIALFSVLSFVSLSVAFFISNGSFYLFSGRFSDMSLGGYAARTSQYYWQYIESGVTYLVPAVLLYIVLSAVTHHQAKHA